MTSEPLAPGAAAIVLYRQVDRDDRGQTAHENDFMRIKILTEEGRKYADVEIPFNKSGGNNVGNIHGRTIRPDGTAVEYQGKVFEKAIVKAKGVKYMAKTFTLPDVEIGSIIEYSYTLDLSENILYDSQWILSDELFTKSASFSLKPYTNDMVPFYCRWSWHDLPAGSEPPKEGPDHVVRLEVHNVPAFQSEDYMPPENELKARVDFTYSQEQLEKDPSQFWKNRGKKLNGAVESFVNKRNAMQAAVEQIVSPSDSPEAKLQKIYARVQQLRNTSYEVEKTEQQQKRDKEEKEASNVEDVWKRGYGDERDLTWLFLGLVRAAGIEADPVIVSDRSNFFFNPAIMDAYKLDADVVLVKVNGKEIYFGPGAAFTPFGMLEWPETGVQGLRLDKNGGTWVHTTLPESNESVVERKAVLTLSDTGTLEGKLTITYTGLEGMQRRMEERNEDDAARKKFLEEDAKEDIPVGSEVDLTNKPDWSSSSSPLIAEYTLKIPGWVSGAGRHAMVPVGLFSAPEKHVFEHAQRVHPIYFEYPFEKWDDVAITLPAGWQVSSLPPAKSKDEKLIDYELKTENDKNTIHLTRKLKVDLLMLESKYYPALRSFYEVVRSGDDQQILLQPAGATASN
ncbi:MAG TPA: DUF3857 domain-containing protein [Terriglobales bacterium]|nr:DUF3857 domain-containing protein [Terriglobales bacterium]